MSKVAVLLPEFNDATFYLAEFQLPLRLAISEEFLMDLLYFAKNPMNS